MGCAPCFCYRTGISSAGSNVSVRAEWTIVCACLASASASQSCRRCRACLGRFAVANRVDGDAAAIAWERVRSDGRSRLRRSRRTTAGLRPVDAPLGTNGHKTGTETPERPSPSTLAIPHLQREYRSRRTWWDLQPPACQFGGSLFSRPKPQVPDQNRHLCRRFLRWSQPGSNR